MGENVDRMEMTEDSVRKFTRALLNDIKALEIMLDKGMIESGVERIGAEQELCLVDADCEPAPLNMDVLEGVNDPCVVTEYAKFNLEVNLDPQPFKGDCFSRMQDQLREKLRLISDVAAQHNANVALVGILPTIRQRDLVDKNMTPLPRYQMLNENLMRMRGGQPFRLSINGADELLTKHESSLLESCNTSFQVHLQVSPHDFVKKYNFAQLINAPLLAACSNSALLFGKRLWKETRIALFQQSIDTRRHMQSVREHSARVHFGKSWLKHNVVEIFKDNLARHRLIMHAAVEEDSLAVLEAGGIPKLKALCLFNGTIYPWNRACYGICNGKPHLRIENRVLPSGPTVADEMANTAFWLGLMKGMPDEYANLNEIMNFDGAIFNFFKAAKMGLDSRFTWLNDRVYTADDLILNEMLPMAREGLKMAEVDSSAIDEYMGIIQERVSMRHTGSLWMFESFTNMLREGTRSEAAAALTSRMVHLQKEGKPVHLWPLAELGRSAAESKYMRIEQIMSTDLYTVGKDDLVSLAAHIMHWKRVRHVPVEDDQRSVVGMVDSKAIIYHLVEDGCEVKDMVVEEIMVPDPITIAPDTPTLDALAIMAERNDSCLLVVEDGKLVGMVTEYDFTKISAKLLRSRE